MTSCILTIILNLTKEPWNIDDQKSLITAKSRCVQLYDDSECLVKFIKTEPGVYKAICGECKNTCNK